MPQANNVPISIAIPSGAPNDLLSISGYLTQLVSALNNWISQAATAINSLLGVGTYVRAKVLTSSPTSLSNGSPKNLLSISLPAGDWDVNGMAVYTMTGAFTTVYGAISTTSLDLSQTDPDLTTWYRDDRGGTALTDQAAAIPTLRLSLTATTLVYLIVDVAFSTGAATAAGIIRARRAQ